MEQSAAYWVEKLALQPHPEGGYFREVYRSAEQIPAEALPCRFGGSRSYATGIYFLLEAGSFSTLHRISSDEGWHFYAGSSLNVYVIDPNGKLEIIRLGRDPEKGEVLQAVVPYGCWFGARLAAGSGYALVGCTVAPGFDFKDFQMGERQELLEAFPRHKDIIEMLTHPAAS